MHGPVYRWGDLHDWKQNQCKGVGPSFFGYIKRHSLPETDHAEWWHEMQKQGLWRDYRQPVLSGLPSALLKMDGKNIKVGVT